MSTPFNKIIACNVRFLRQEKGMTIEELAQRAFMALGTASNIENANRKRDVDRNYIVQIAKALDITPDTLTEENPEIQQMFQHAEELIDLRDFGEKTGKLINELMDKVQTRGPRERLNALLLIGEFHYYLGELSVAEEKYDAAFEIANDIFDEELIYKSLYNASTVKIARGETDEAFKLMNHMIEAYPQQNHARNFYMLGILLSERTKWSEAEAYFQKALLTLDLGKVSEKKLAGRSYQALGHLYKSIQQHEKSIQYSKKALELSRQTEDILGTTYAHITLGEVLQIIGEHSAAKVELFHALESTRQLGEVRKYEICRINFLIALCDKDYTTMKNLLTELEDIGVSPNKMASMYRLTAQSAASLKLYGETQEYYEKALTALEVL